MIFPSVVRSASMPKKFLTDHCQAKSGNHLVDDQAARRSLLISAQSFKNPAGRSGRETTPMFAGDEGSTMEPAAMLNACMLRA